MFNDLKHFFFSFFKLGEPLLLGWLIAAKLAYGVSGAFSVSKNRYLHYTPKSYGILSFDIN